MNYMLKNINQTDKAVNYNSALKLLPYQKIFRNLNYSWPDTSQFTFDAYSS